MITIFICKNFIKSKMASLFFVVSGSTTICVGSAHDRLIKMVEVRGRGQELVNSSSRQEMGRTSKIHYKLRKYADSIAWIAECEEHS
jgi:hypothetical protein